MCKKPLYEELEKRVKVLEKKVLELNSINEELCWSSQKYYDLYENAPIAYFSVSSDDGSILRVNNEAVRLLGYKKEAIKQMKIFDLYCDTPHGVPRAKELFLRFQSGESIKDEELQMKRMDGKAVWINLNMEPFLNHEGKIVESRSMAIDISKRKAAEEAQLRSEKQYRLFDYISCRTKLCTCDLLRNLPYMVIFQS